MACSKRKKKAAPEKERVVEPLHRPRAVEEDRLRAVEEDRPRVGDVGNVGGVRDVGDVRDVEAEVALGADGAALVTPHRSQS